MFNLSRTHLGVVALAAGCSAGPSGAELLAAGQYRRVLSSTRPKNVAAHRLRARALIRLGELEAARAELHIGLVMDPEDAGARRLLTEIARRTGDRGAELRQLEQLVATNGRDESLRRRLAQLLLERAAIRLTPSLGLHDKEAAGRDLARAARLDSRLVGTVAELRGAGHAQAAALVQACPGIPTIDPLRPLPAASCTLPQPLAPLERAADRHVLSGCADARVALALERNGCTVQASRAWERLRRQAPRDPRWPFALARLALAERAIDRAELLLLDYRYLSRDRAAASLLAARLLALAGYPRRSGRIAVETLALARAAERQLAAISLLIALGQRGAAQQGAQALLSSRSAGDQHQLARLERRLAEILGGPASLPARPPRTPQR